jgi:plasmid stabilization system protein ParE
MTRERADFVLDNIATQVERVRNNSARRRLRRALEKAKAKRALTLEVGRMRAAKARTLTLDLPAGPHVQVFRSAHPPVAGDDLVRVPFDVGVR